MARPSLDDQITELEDRLRASDAVDRHYLKFFPHKVAAIEKGRQRLSSAIETLKWLKRHEEAVRTAIRNSADKK